jgi:hypothetical protein
MTSEALKDHDDSELCRSVSWAPEARANGSPDARLAGNSPLIRERPEAHAWKATAAVCVLFGCALPVTARLVAGPRGADVHVEWRPSVDAPTRERLTVRYRLENPRKLLDTYTWRYELVDPSTDNIRALVNDPAIEDTHEIDREAYTLAPGAPRTSRRLYFATGGDTLVGIADGLAIAILALALITVATRGAVRQFLRRGIPEIDAATAGLFRIVFGAAVLLFFAFHRIDASSLAVTFDSEIEGRSSTAVLQWLRAHPTITDQITPWLLLTGSAFTIGLFTRLTYPLFVAGVLVWAHVAMAVSSTSIHPYGTLVLALVTLLPSSWGDARSVDAWRRRAGGRTGTTSTPSLRYGYSTWVPGLALGVGYAAAAWSKLSVPPHWSDWVLNGTVKYYFLGDEINAPVDWGVQLAGFPFLSILASFAVIAVEGALITAAFTRNEWYRLGLGTAALALFSGFYLFMGIFWPAWWCLLLGLLPWQWLSPRTAPAPASSSAGLPSPTVGTSSRDWLPSVQLVAIVLVIAQQLVSSSLKLERIPMFSWYDLYAGTYESPEEWSATRQPSYRVVLHTDRGPASLSCDPNAAFLREFDAALRGSEEARAKVWRAVRLCRRDLDDVRGVALEGDVRIFNWDRLTFVVNRSAVTLGPLSADTTASVEKR